jgi:DNA polymerase III delta prime subunit
MIKKYKPPPGNQNTLGQNTKTLGQNTKTLGQNTNTLGQNTSEVLSEYIPTSPPPSLRQVVVTPEIESPPPSPQSPVATQGLIMAPQGPIMAPQDQVPAAAPKVKRTLSNSIKSSSPFSIGATNRVTTNVAAIAAIAPTSTTLPPKTKRRRTRDPPPKTVYDELNTPGKKKLPPNQSTIFTRSFMRKGQKDGRAEPSGVRTGAGGVGFGIGRGRSGRADLKRKSPPLNWQFDSTGGYGGCGGNKKRKSQRKKRKPREPAQFSTTATISIPALPSLSIEEEARHLAFRKEGRPPPDRLADRQVVHTFDDIVGHTNEIAQLQKWMTQVEKRQAGVDRALLLVGPSGCGKSLMARLLFEKFGYRMYTYSVDDYVQSKSASFAVYSERGVDEVIMKLATRSSALEKFGICLEDIGSMRPEVQNSLKKGRDRPFKTPERGAEPPFKTPERGAEPPFKTLSNQDQSQGRGLKGAAMPLSLSPIIMTCEPGDLANLSIVARMCQVIELKPLSMEDLAILLNRACVQEGIEISASVQAKILAGCGGDVRRLYNTLQFLVLQADHHEQVDEILDCSTVFFNQRTNVEFVKQFLACDKPLSQMDDMIQSHPVSTFMTLAENYPRILSHDNGGDNNDDNSMDLEMLEHLAKSADYFSEAELFDHHVHHDLDWELQEVASTLMTWGGRGTCSIQDPSKPLPLKRAKSLELISSSAFYSAKQKARYRQKVMANLEQISLRGVDFIHYGNVICEYVEAYSTQAKGTRAKDVTNDTDNNKVQFESLFASLKQEGYTVRDIQDMWKIVHMREDVSMPNPKGKLALRNYL